MLKSKLARVILTSSAASFNTFDHKVATSIDVLNNVTNTNGTRKYGQRREDYFDQTPKCETVAVHEEYQHKNQPLGYYQEQG